MVTPASVFLLAVCTRERAGGAGRIAASGCMKSASRPTLAPAAGGGLEVGRVDRASAWIGEQGGVTSKPGGRGGVEVGAAAESSDRAVAAGMITGEGCVGRTDVGEDERAASRG